MSMTVKLDKEHQLQNVFFRFETLFEANSGLRQEINAMISSWERETSKALLTQFPYEEHTLKFEKWSNQPATIKTRKPELRNAVHDYLGLCREIGQPEHPDYWRGLFETPKEDGGALAAALRSNFLSPEQLEQQWSLTLEKARQAWELEELTKRRKIFLKQLLKNLENLEIIQKTLQALGIGTGLFQDLSSGSLTPQRFEEFKRWANYLAKDAGVRALCELMGKIRQMEMSERIERTKINKKIMVLQPDNNSREEIIGIRLGRDLEHALPSELALLANTDTETLFDLKFLEARLMCFEMQGTQTVDMNIESEEDISIEEAEKLGPMILCIDTSGSMSGAPETIAKAVSLFMASRAREQKRACYLINFSTSIRTLDLSPKGLGIDRLIDFLKMSFHGGTDAGPALRHALELMEQEDYKKSDVLVISDFIMSALPTELAQRIENRKQGGNHFYSLAIGELFMSERMRGIFNREWIYSPQKSSIEELIRVSQWT